MFADSMLALSSMLESDLGSSLGIILFSSSSLPLTDLEACSDIPPSSRAQEAGSTNQLLQEGKGVQPLKASAT